MAKKKGASTEKAKAKEATTAKAEKKAEKCETKKTKGTRGGAGDNKDLDAIPEKLAKEWEAKHKVDEETFGVLPLGESRLKAKSKPAANQHR